MLRYLEPIKGRGAPDNANNRFEVLGYHLDTDITDVSVLENPDRPKTQFFKDSSKTIINKNDSPDIGFSYSVNPYRGCEHGCIYCFARPTHEYLGFSPGIDFETKIMVKENAPQLLRKELSKKSWQADPIAFGINVDAFQLVERKLELSRRCLEVFAEFRQPVTCITKNFLITRDIDYLSMLARDQAVLVLVSITSLDQSLQSKMEPRTSIPQKRLEAIRTLTDAGIPVGVMVAPVIPGLTDHEILPIMDAAKKAGAVTAGHTLVRLPFAVKDLFENWLTAHFPERKDKVLARIRDVRGGKLNDPNFGSRMRGQGIFAEQIHATFKIGRQKLGFGHFAGLSSAAFRSPRGKQMGLFA